MVKYHIHGYSGIFLETLDFLAGDLEISLMLNGNTGNGNKLFINITFGDRSMLFVTQLRLLLITAMFWCLLLAGEQCFQ